ncbi:hypothetical protein [Allofranklinella schreckenbergeri]|nr:hypothetical protein [Allofranklinella schreckenbergeri]
MMDKQRHPSTTNDNGKCMQELIERILGHRGHFVCAQISAPASQHKKLPFTHICTPPTGDASDLPEVGGLRRFYSAIGSLTLYHVAASDEAGAYIASPAQWASLQHDFLGGFEGMSAQDWSAEDQAWIEACCVIGTEPHTGNYFLMRMEGDDAGWVYSFTHAGLEFDEEAPSLPAFVEKLLTVNNSLARRLAYHMRFSEDGGRTQWTLHSIHDNTGACGRLEA